MFSILQLICQNKLNKSWVDLAEDFKKNVDYWTQRKKELKKFFWE